MTTVNDILKALGGDNEDVEPKALTGDAKLRAENPGLQELWEQYQTMLKLIKPAKAARDVEAEDMLAMIRARQYAAPCFKPRKLTTNERLDALETLINQRSDQ